MDSNYIFDSPGLDPSMSGPHLEALLNVYFSLDQSSTPADPGSSLNSHHGGASSGHVPHLSTSDSLRDRAFSIESTQEDEDGRRSVLSTSSFNIRGNLAPIRARSGSDLNAVAASPMHQGMLSPAYSVNEGELDGEGSSFAGAVTPSMLRLNQISHPVTPGGVNNSFNDSDFTPRDWENRRSSVSTATGLLTPTLQSSNAPGVYQSHHSSLRSLNASRAGNDVSIRDDVSVGSLQDDIHDSYEQSTSFTPFPTGSSIFSGYSNLNDSGVNRSSSGNMQSIRGKGFSGQQNIVVNGSTRISFPQSLNDSDTSNAQITTKTRLADQKPISSSNSSAPVKRSARNINKGPAGSSVIFDSPPSFSPMESASSLGNDNLASVSVNQGNNTRNVQQKNSAIILPNNAARGGRRKSTGTRLVDETMLNSSADSPAGTGAPPFAGELATSSGLNSSLVAGRGRGRGGRVSNPHFHVNSMQIPQQPASIPQASPVSSTSIPQKSAAVRSKQQFPTVVPHVVVPQVSMPPTNAIDDERPRKRFMWTEDLHRRFVTAIFDFGVQNATPKTLYQLMQPAPAEMTSDHIKSHLQKFRLHTKNGRDIFLRDFDRARREAESRAAEYLKRTGLQPFPVQFSVYPMTMAPERQSDPPPGIRNVYDQEKEDNMQIVFADPAIQERHLAANNAATSEDGANGSASAIPPSASQCCSRCRQFSVLFDFGVGLPDDGEDSFSDFFSSVLALKQAVMQEAQSDVAVRAAAVAVAAAAAVVENSSNLGNMNIAKIISDNNDIKNDKQGGSDSLPPASPRHQQPLQSPDQNMTPSQNQAWIQSQNQQMLSEAVYSSITNNLNTSAEANSGASSLSILNPSANAQNPSFLSLLTTPIFGSTPNANVAASAAVAAAAAMAAVNSSANSADASPLHLPSMYSNISSLFSGQSTLDELESFTVDGLTPNPGHALGSGGISGTAGGFGSSFSNFASAGLGILDDTSMATSENVETTTSANTASDTRVTSGSKEDTKDVLIDTESLVDDSVQENGVRKRARSTSSVNSNSKTEDPFSPTSRARTSSTALEDPSGSVSQLGNGSQAAVTIAAATAAAVAAVAAAQGQMAPMAMANLSQLGMNVGLNVNSMMGHGLIIPTLSSSTSMVAVDNSNSTINPGSHSTGNTVTISPSTVVDVRVPPGSVVRAATAVRAEIAAHVRAYREETRRILQNSMATLAAATGSSSDSVGHAVNAATGALSSYYFSSAIQSQDDGDYSDDDDDDDEEEEEDDDEVVVDDDDGSSSQNGSYSQSIQSTPNRDSRDKDRGASTPQAITYADLLLQLTKSLLPPKSAASNSNLVEEAAHSLVSRSGPTSPNPSAAVASTANNVTASGTNGAALNDTISVDGVMENANDLMPPPPTPAPTNTSAPSHAGRRRQGVHVSVLQRNEQLALISKQISAQLRMHRAMLQRREGQFAHYSGEAPANVAIVSGVPEEEPGDLLSLLQFSNSAQSESFFARFSLNDVRAALPVAEFEGRLLRGVVLEPLGDLDVDVDENSTTVPV